MIRNLLFDYSKKIKIMVREIRGLKCPNHDYVRDNHHFMY